MARVVSEFYFKVNEYIVKNFAKEDNFGRQGIASLVLETLKIFGANSSPTIKEANISCLS